MRFKSAILFILGLPVYATVTVTGASGTVAWSGTAATGGTRPYRYTVTCSAGIGDMAEAQAAADDAWAGDTVAYTAGCEWQANSTFGGLRLHKRRAGTGDLVITTTEDAKLPNNGTRITGAYRPLMPTFRSMGNSAMAVSLRAANIKIRGIRFAEHTRSSANWWTAYNYRGLLLLGGLYNNGGPLSVSYHVNTSPASQAQPVIPMADTAWATVGQHINISHGGGTREETATILSINPGVSITLTTNLTFTHPAGDFVETLLESADDLPSNITVQHCMFDTEWLFSSVRLLTFVAANSTVRDNYLDYATIYGADSQVIVADVGHDNLIENNAIGYASENWMSGGAKASYDSEPTDYLFRLNTFFKMPERDRIEEWGQLLTRPEGRTVFKGRFVRPTGGSVSTPWFQAQNSGRACATEPNWALTSALNDLIVDCGVTWRRSNSNKSLNKNLWEVKSGQNLTVQHNAFIGFTDGYCCNQQQPAVIAIKSVSSPGAAVGGTPLYCDDPATVWPTCYRGRTRNIQILNNFIDNYVQFAGMMGGQNRPVEFADTYTIEGNFGIMREPHKSTSPSSLGAFMLGPGFGSTPVANVKIRNNTLYAPPTYPYSGSAAIYVVGGSGLWPNGELSGNIMLRQLSGLGGDGTFPDGSSTGNNTPATRFPGTNTGGVLGKNIFIGSPTAATNYQGLAFGNCPTTAACTPNWDYDHAVYGKLFRNFDAGDLAVRPTHGFAHHGSVNGTDIGADLSQVPMVLHLKATPTDRAVLFTWRVTPVIKDTPCVIEVHTSPDFVGDFKLDAVTTISGAYVGELGSIATYYRQDADDADRNVRKGLDRMLVVGHSVPLADSTTYYYRLQCGGDTRRGSFTTLASLSGTTSLSRTATGLTSLAWRTTYSRTTGAASGGVAGTCSGGTCTLTGLPRGSIGYLVGSGVLEPYAVQ
jgi:hypothetical protein